MGQGPQQAAGVRGACWRLETVCLFPIRAKANGQLVSAAVFIKTSGRTLPQGRESTQLPALARG